MNRRNPNAESGWIIWPKHLLNTGEGGSFVYLIFLEENDDEGNDFFIRCADVPIRLPHIHNMNETKIISKDISILAAVCLGTSGGSFCTGEPWEDPMWFCTLDDLYPEGQELVKSLESLYGRKGVLVTCLDT